MNSNTRNVIVGLAATFVAAGCAGGSKRADATAQKEVIERAAASIDEAEKAGAYEHGSADLNRAREKLSAARKASEDGEDEVAQRLAVEADLDADVAAATARNQEMQAAVTELQQSIRALQDELQRNEQRGVGRL
jgi:type VI protein secretion system component VasK